MESAQDSGGIYREVPLIRTVNFQPPATWVRSNARDLNATQTANSASTQAREFGEDHEWLNLRLLCESAFGSVEEMR